MWLLTIQRSFRLSPVLVLEAIWGITCAQPMMVPMLTPCKATATGACLKCRNFETRSKLAKFSGMVVSASANQFSTKAPSSFRSLILNSHCSCHERRPFSAPYHLPGHCVTHAQSFCRSPPRQLWLTVHRQIWDMRSPSKPFDLNLNTKVSTELHWVQLFILYICLGMTLMLDKLPCAIVYCHVVRCVLHIVE